MKTYIMLFVAHKNTERSAEEIRVSVDTDDLIGVKEVFAMALEQEHHVSFRCAEIREVAE